MMEFGELVLVGILAFMFGLGCGSVIAKAEVMDGRCTLDELDRARRMTEWRAAQPKEKR